MPSSRYFVSPDDVPAYHPAHHRGTVNKRLIGRESVGACQLEVVLGVIANGQGAELHAHPDIEQVCYVLEGRARAEVEGEAFELGPGECCFFPAGIAHGLTATGDAALKILVIYAPPYEESSKRMRPRA
ncbi:MAG: cupin domain-containing protein [Acetobacteraceae bacterium]